MIRPASPDDAPAMAQTLSDWIDATTWMPRVHTQDEDFGFCQKLIETTEVWVADCASGFGFIARHDDSIDALYLSPDLRGQGWGTALLDAIRQDRNHLTLWTFQANREAVTFYKMQNFHISDVTDGSGNAEKLPDYFMTWTRTP